MQNVNSTQQFERLKHTIEDEDRQVKIIEDKIRRRETEHRRAREVFEKIDKEMKELEIEKNEIQNRRANLHREFLILQREIEEGNKRNKIQVKI